jgi:hypothetical protein
MSNRSAEQIATRQVAGPRLSGLDDSVGDAGAVDEVQSTDCYDLPGSAPGEVTVTASPGGRQELGIGRGRHVRITDHQHTERAWTAHGMTYVWRWHDDARAAEREAARACGCREDLADRRHTA